VFYLKKAELDFDFLPTLARIPPLTHLTIDNCAMAESTFKSLFSPAALPYLQSLCIDELYDLQRMPLDPIIPVPLVSNLQSVCLREVGVFGASSEIFASYLDKIIWSCDLEFLTYTSQSTQADSTRS
jgi:hypothetical protein